MGVLHSFSIKNIFNDKIDWRFFIFMWRSEVWEIIAKYVWVKCLSLLTIVSKIKSSSLLLKL